MEASSIRAVVNEGTDIDLHHRLSGNVITVMFQDKVVIITGASSGIGAGTAVAFAKEGAKLVLGGRNEENLARTVRECQEEGIKAENILPVLGDLTIEDNCNALVDKAVEKFGRLNILVNNAGSFVTGNIEQLAIADVDFMFSTLVRSVVMVTKRAVPHLKETKGAIVNVSSGSSKIWDPNLIAYGMAKAALDHFTQSLAQDIGPSGVRANCVLPGIINTPIFVTSPGGLASGHPEKLPELLKNMEKQHALKCTGEVHEVANVILFLSSDAASFMTGALVPVDGGAIGRREF